MKKKLITRISSIALASIMTITGMFTLGTLAKAKDNTINENLKIAVMSDLHYLSNDLIKDTSDYETDLNSDRKIFTESAAILDTMLKTVKSQGADVLIITGDLTKDGEQECHKDVAQTLKELKSQMPNLKVYVVPGNHDIRNSNGKNFNTDDGNAITATRTEPEDYINIYSDITYDDDSIIARYTPPAGKEAGSLSYVARPAEGFTFIGIDSTRYSSDNTESGINEHETSGQISADLEAWVLEQIAEAKERGDTVIGAEHHGMVPHFSMEADLLPMYLVKDYERISTEFADVGMDYIFTGHMHANDVAEITTENGNKLVDIETGSAVTYPCPQRFITITRNANGNNIKETISCETVKDLGPITFVDPVTKQTRTIDNLTEYARIHGFSEDMLSTTVTGFLKSYFSKVLPKNLYPHIAENLVQNIVHDAANISIADDKNLLDYANYIYQAHLGGEDNGVNPAWVNAGTAKIADGTLLNTVLKDVLIKNLCALPSDISTQILKDILNLLPGDIANKLPINIKPSLKDELVKTLLNSGVDAAQKAAPDLFNAVNQLLLKIVDSLNNDTNFPKDNNFTITRNWVSKTAITPSNNNSNSNQSVTANDTTPLGNIDTQNNNGDNGQQEQQIATIDSIANTGDSSAYISISIALSSALALLLLNKKK